MQRRFSIAENTWEIMEEPDSVLSLGGAVAAWLAAAQLLAMLNAGGPKGAAAFRWRAVGGCSPMGTQGVRKNGKAKRQFRRIGVSA